MSKQKLDAQGFERTAAVIGCLVVTIVEGRGYNTNEKWRVVGERGTHHRSFHEYKLRNDSGEEIVIYAALTRPDLLATFEERKKQRAVNSRIGLNK